VYTPLCTIHCCALRRFWFFARAICVTIRFRRRRCRRRASTARKPSGAVPNMEKRPFVLFSTNVLFLFFPSVLDFFRPPARARTHNKYYFVRTYTYNYYYNITLKYVRITRSAVCSEIRDLKRTIARKRIYTYGIGSFEKLIRHMDTIIIHYDDTITAAERRRLVCGVRARWCANMLVKTYTVRRLNSGHSRSPKCRPLFRGGKCLKFIQGKRVK